LLVADPRRASVLRHTRLQEVPSTDGIRLHLADDVRATWHATQLQAGDPEAPLPYWAVAWGGGLALARYLREHPAAVADRRVLDVGSGSGLVAIAAARAGARHVTALDVDPFAIAAIGLNARANAVRVDVRRRDAFGDEVPDVDVILAGDTWYAADLATRALDWLRRAGDAGVEVLIGDPGRADLPIAALVELARYEVRTTSDLEDLALRQAAVYGLAD
jgi:predicted nicotinamide N-methyase